MSGKRSATVIITLLSLLAFPAAASAADTWASPGGTGSACTEANPCSLFMASQTVTPEQDVHIGSGNYGSPASPLTDRLYTTADRVHFIGHPDANLYIDSSSTDSSVSLTDYQQIRGNGMKIHSFDLQGVTLYGQTQIDRLWVRTTLNDSTACAIYRLSAVTGASILSSLCAANTSNGGRGIFLYANQNDDRGGVHGSTGIATGTNSVGIGVENTGIGGGGSEPSFIAIYHSIANASGPGSLDISSQNDSALNKACVIALNVASVTGANGQCAGVDNNPIRQSPDFVSPGIDFHLKADSALIDGINPVGLLGPIQTAFDLDGYPRDPLNPDPGAYERQAPLATTLPATGLGLTGATLNAEAQTSYGTGSYLVEYGLTTSYGDSTPPGTVGRALPAEKVSQTITGLAPGTTYHARVVITSPDGDVTTGNDITFRTTENAVCRVPEIKGLKLTKAKKRLKKANCRIGKVKRRSGKFVRKQSPKAGKVLKSGSRVKVTIGPKR